MGEFATMAGEILSTVLPKSDVGKILWLLIIGGFALVLAGRFKLKWIGSGVKHIFRWLRCKTRNKHVLEFYGLGRYDLNTGLPSGAARCSICGKFAVL